MLRCVGFLNCHRLELFGQITLVWQLKMSCSMSSGNNEAGLSMLYALCPLLYHRHQLTSNSSTAEGFSAYLCLSTCGSTGFVLLYPVAHLHLTSQTYRDCIHLWRFVLFQIGLKVASEDPKLGERLTGQVLVTLFLWSSFLIWFFSNFYSWICMCWTKQVSSCFVSQHGNHFTAK